MPEQLVTGFYRYTDIWFDWEKALEKALGDGRPVKAILNYEALTHPDHPLRDPQKDGIEFSIGTFENGESRLLFSSAQVEYIRYWLYTMGLSKDPIPLPYSDCLIRRSTLKTVSPVLYKDAKALKGAVKEIDKRNKKLKKSGADSGLNARRLLFERVRALWAEKKGCWCAIDIEAWERDSTVLTEFGWSLQRWEEGNSVEEYGHLIVREHQFYTNGTYVPEARMKYDFGQSEIISARAFKARINTLVDSLAQYGPVFLVFHDANSDVKFMRGKGIEAPLLNLQFILPDDIKDGLYVVDTSDLYGALEGTSNDRRGLERMCRELGMRVQNMHNAGNDARYTFLALREMAGNEPLDMQRERRWPTRTSGVKVLPQDEDDDSDDDGFGYGPYNAKTGEYDEQWMSRFKPTASNVFVTPVPPESTQGGDQ